ncbi:hypothetical protein ACOSQ3_032522 [Xanthoceras sorbifolium]
MSIICWNVRGLGSPRAFLALRKVIRKQSPNLVFLSETRLKGEWAAKIKTQLGFSGGLHVDCVGKSGGLMLLWNDVWDVSVLSFSRGHIDVVIEMENNLKWRFTGFYGCPVSNHRTDSWELLRRLKAVNRLPWLCGGDFNELLHMEEKSGGNERTGPGMFNFCSIVELCDFVDLGFSGPLFTWNNKRGGARNVQERLDRFFATSHWVNLFSGIKVEHLGFMFSDHRPISARFVYGGPNISGDRDRKFKFEPFWLKDEECYSVICSAWGGFVNDSSGRGLRDKLVVCADRLANWSKVKFGSLRKAIDRKRCELNLLYDRLQSEQVLNDIKLRERELESLLSKEELYWKQRSRVDWLLAGDKNSKFFHRRATARKKKNMISSLVNGRGIRRESEQGMSSVVLDYFSDLFKSIQPSSSDFSAASSFLKRKVDTHMAGRLGEAFTRTEVCAAVFEMGPNKAPGPDGFHAFFFQKFWNVVGEDVSSVCLNVLNGGCSIKEFNATNVVLIPKVKNPERMTDFRPISLCSVIYKTVSKVMANRLKEILPHIISSEQSAFVPGRLIFDNIMVAFELLHSIKKQKKGKRGYAAIKLDMSKAYDRVEWGFLELIMEKLGFPNQFRALVMDCVSTSKLSFMINGKSVGEVTPQRGLRQGCPLSPYLFLLCAEVLSSLIKGNESNGQSLGMRCCRGSPLVSHLFFADDSIVFCRASVQNCEKLKQILNVYEKASGQRINLQKSNITFSPNVEDVCSASILNCLGLVNAQAHDKYLGLPTLVGKNKRKTFSDIKERVWRKIRGWKGNLFSMGGKEVLIKAVAQAIPTFTMSIFQLPSVLCNELCSMIMGFWWGASDGNKKMCWVSRDKLCSPKICGGLGFKDLSLFNQALLGKQAWRIVMNKDSLVSRVLKAKYFRQEDFLYAPLKQGSSHLWRSLVWGRSLLLKGLRWRVGNGKNIRAFQDPWIPRESTFRPFSNAPVDNLMVASFISPSSHSWDLAKLDQVFVAADRDSILEIPLSFGECNDSLIWHFDKNGEYSVKSGYRVAAQEKLALKGSSSCPDSKWWLALWNLNIPPKIKIFIWRVCLNAIPSLFNLCSRKIVVDPCCSRCGDAPESSAHALFWCSSVRPIWESTVFWDILNLQCHISCFDLILWVFVRAKRAELEEFCMILWGVWSERNAVCHSKSPRFSADLVSWSLSLLREFQGTQKVFGSPLQPPRQSRSSPWLPPPAGSLKLNTDAAVKSGCSVLGSGAVVRDSQGKVVAASAKPLVGFFPAELGELLALREGLLLAKEFNLIIAWVELDAVNVVTRVLNSLSSSVLDPIISDVKVLFRAVGVSNCHAIPRSGNGMAHSLASLVFSSKEEFYWFNPEPNFLVGLL